MGQHLRGFLWKLLYYIKSIEQPYNYERKDNNKLFNYKRIRSNPRNYTFNNISRDDIIINDIKASRKYREIVFFQNLKKYMEPGQSIIAKDKVITPSEETYWRKITTTHNIIKQPHDHCGHGIFVFMRWFIWTWK